MNGERAPVVTWEVPKDRPVVTAGEVHLWRADLDTDSDLRKRLIQFLSAEERSRAERFVFERDRHRWVAARGILRQILGSYLGQHPGGVEIVNQPGGKPCLRLDRKVGDPPTKFNVSHSGGLALVAVTLGQEVGIDVENIRPELATAEIAEKYFSSEEQREFRSLPEELQTEAFFLCWTRKEAFLKASGEGLQTPLDSFTVSLTPGRPAVLRCPETQRWNLFSFYPATGSVGAVVTEGRNTGRRFWEWQNTVR